MARLVRREPTGPIKIDPATLDPSKPIFICACGLSRAFPFCDGTHKICRNEEPGTLYEYDPRTAEVLRARPDEHGAAGTPPG
ncbi:MAG TPA: CDGSH iron-sulfur domain-containing protein [Phycisphaerales bacterium]|nr:CDGSH iron-sulfur domain-containing protein [Phycisphaerales bacterium]